MIIGVKAMSDPDREISRKARRSKALEPTAKRAYQKPKIDWEKKMEPSVHAATCALESGHGPLCDASPTA
jgi:hypothetical protein